MSNGVTIDAMNEVIALFDGLTKHDDDRYGYPHFKDSKMRFVGYAHNLDYDTDWNKLMPVVEMLKDKLYDLWNDNQIQERPQMEISLNTNTIKLVDIETGWYLIDPISKDTLKATVYHACYEIIIWLNQQKQSNE